MPTSRSIPPEAWAQAREALIFYFSRRHGLDRAEDLAQETLTAVWTREDYQFDTEADFLRVCLGFARRISQAGYRQAQKDLVQSSMERETVSPSHHSGSARATEERILLEQVCNLGESRLREQDWQLVVEAATAEGGFSKLPVQEQNRRRVSLYRARKKLGEIIGWRR